MKDENCCWFMLLLNPVFVVGIISGLNSLFPEKFNIGDEYVFDMVGEYEFDKKAWLLITLAGLDKFINPFCKSFFISSFISLNTVIVALLIPDPLPH